MDKAREIYDKLIWESKNRFEGGLLDYTIVNLSYASNKLEGSTMTLDQTWFLYNYDSIIPNNEDEYTPTKVNDIVEMKNHFLLFKEMLKTIYEPLSDSLIKRYHKILKTGTNDEVLGYNIGEYKKLKNVAGNMDTSFPKDVEKDMLGLLSSYQKKESVHIEDIADFHAKYEKIHPFQDGNGRTGRIIMFKECLKNGIVPFIIDAGTKNTYVNVMNLYRENGNKAFIRYLERQQAEYLEEAEYFISESTDESGL